MRRTAEDIVEIGRRLIKQRENLGRGNFVPWIEAEFDMSERTAYRFISVAERLGNNSASLAGIGREALYELAAPKTPPEVQLEVERLVAEGKVVTAADVRLPGAPVV